MKLFDRLTGKKPEPKKELRNQPLTVVADELAASGKYSPKTMKNYRSHLRRFIEFMELDIPPAEVTLAQLEEFREHMQKTHAKQTARIAVDAIAAMVKFADPRLLKERYRGNVQKLYHIRIDIADSESHKHPGRLERVFQAMMRELNEKP